MQEGNTTAIEYVTWDGSAWRAELEELHGGLIPSTFADSKFIHTNIASGASHKDKWLAYFTNDGSRWRTQCHSHSGPFSEDVSFDFEHFRGDSDDGDHPDVGMIFRAPDGAYWRVSVNGMKRAQTGQRPTFNVRRL